MKSKTHQSIVDELNRQNLDMCIDYEKSLQLLRDRIAAQNEQIAALEAENWRLKAQLADAAHAYLDTPLCVECGGELSETDVEAGEDVCLDCAASIALERDASSVGVDTDGIEYQPGTLLATVRVRLAENEKR